MQTPRYFSLMMVLLLSLGLAGAALAGAQWAGTRTAPVPSPDLSRSQHTAPTKVAAGDRITYTIGLLNTGGPAGAVELTDVLPLGATYIPGSLTCSAGTCAYEADSRTILWNGDLPSTAITQTRYYLTAVDGTNVVYEVDLLKGGWWEPHSWGMVMTFTVPGLLDTAGIDYDAEHGVLYHSDFLTDVIVVTDLSGTYLSQFRCPSPAGINSGVTYIEGSDPPEIWVTDFLSNQTTRCNTTGIAPGKVIETFPNPWAVNTIGLVYNPREGWVRYAHEGEVFNSAEIWDVDTALPHTTLFSLSLSALNPGWSATLDNRDGVEFDLTTGTYFLPDFNGDLTQVDDNLIEITPEGIILNAWELDGPGNDSYDGSYIGPVMDIAIVPVEPVLISFAVQIEAAYAETITNTAYLTAPTLSAPVQLTATTEIVDTLYEFWDFETSAEGWTPYANSDWQWGIPSRGYANGPQTAHSGVKVWGTQLAGQANDAVISHTLTITAVLPNDPGGLVLQWWDWYGAETEDSRSVLVNDLEVWNDGGDHHQPEWQHQTVDLSAFAGASGIIQFRLSTCCSPPGPPGWYIDDVALHSSLMPPEIGVVGVPVEIELPLHSTGTAALTIQNSGGLGVIWTIVETNTIPSTSHFFLDDPGLLTDIPWLEANPSSGIVGKNGTQMVAIHFDTTSLSPGFYTGTIALLSNDEDTPVMFIPITLTVTLHKVHLPVLHR